MVIEIRLQDKKIKLLIPESSKIESEAGENSATLLQLSTVKSFQLTDLLSHKNNELLSKEQPQKQLENRNHEFAGRSKSKLSITPKQIEAKFINKSRTIAQERLVCKGQNSTVNQSQNSAKVGSKLRTKSMHFNKASQSSTIKKISDASESSSDSDCSEDKAELKLKCIEKFKRTVRKIKIANRFLKYAFGTVKVSLQKDLSKAKYLDILGVLIRVVKECFLGRFRIGFLEVFIEILKISMKVPDLTVIRYSYLLICLACLYLKDDPNTIFACQKLIDFSEKEEDLFTAIKALKILSNLYENK